MAKSPSKGGGGTSTHLHVGKYAPEAFLIPGQDQNGNSMRIYCRVVPMLDRAMDILFSSHRFPFRSKGDLLRWCVDTGVKRLDTMEPVLGSVLAQVDAMHAILRDEELNHGFLTLFNNMTATIGMHVQAQAIGEARRVVTMMKGKINKMQDGYWKQRYLTELETKFGYLLNGATGVEMASWGDIEESAGFDEGDGE